LKICGGAAPVFNLQSEIYNLKSLAKPNKWDLLQLKADG
jgi:hypothetical protein